MVESKLFEIEVEESGGKLKGCIWERCRGFDSWVRFGEASLRYLLEGIETCCREADDQRWAIEWLEGNRKFRMERRMNKAGRFILCSVRDMEAKRYSIIFPEGKGQASGWNLLAVRLRGLGVTPTEGLKLTNMPEAPLKPKGVLKVQWKEKRVETKSYADAVKSTPRRAGESVWLEVGDKEVRGRLEHLKHCLIGRWGSISAPFPELDYVRFWTRHNWEVKGKLSIVGLGRVIMLFDFEQAQEAERVLARGIRNIKENWLFLDRWNPEVGCSLKDSFAAESWVRVVGLPLHLWSFEVFKNIGDGCGGFLAVDEGTRSMSELQWARILVKRVDWEVPSSVHIVLGTGCFSLHLWWESAPWFSQVVPAGSCSGKGGVRTGEEDAGSNRVACCGSQRKGVEQLGVQVEVQDVARNGGNPLFHSNEADAEGTVERRWVDGSAVLVGGGRESPPIGMDINGSGLAGPSRSCGPSALYCGEAQDCCLVSRVDLGRVPRPIPSSLSDGVSGEACGPGQADDGAFYGNKSPVSIPRARDLLPAPSSKGASQVARGDVDPLVGLSRDSLTRVSSQLMDRGLMTDEALCEEASRYAVLCHIPMGGRDFSSPSPSSFGRMPLNEGSLGVSVSEVNEEEQNPLSIILADGSNGVLASRGEKPVAGEGPGKEFEGMLQDLDGCRWDDSYLARFSKFLGFSTDGFEGEILNLLLRTKRRREQNLKKGSSGTTKFDRELKKLEWSINYSGARKENSVVRVGGDRISTVR